MKTIINKTQVLIIEKGEINNNMEGQCKERPGVGMNKLCEKAIVLLICIRRLLVHAASGITRIDTINYLSSAMVTAMLLLWRYSPCVVM